MEVSVKEVPLDDVPLSDVPLNDVPLSLVSASSTDDVSTSAAQAASTNERPRNFRMMSSDAVCAGDIDRGRDSCSPTAHLLRLHCVRPYRSSRRTTSSSSGVDTSSTSVSS